MATMQVVQAHAFGSADVLTLETRPVPIPGPGEVLIKVDSASVNFADIMRRRADPYPMPTTLPFIPGSEVAGEIIAHGPGVSTPPIGAAVFALAGTGAAAGTSGYAQFVSVDATRVVPLPAGMSMETACGLFVAGLTALLIVRDVAAVTSGSTVVVQGASGAVGGYAIQLAKHFGARQVIGSASTERRRALALSHGADAVVDSSAPDWAQGVRDLTNGTGVDAVLEIGGGSSLESSLTALAPFGRAVIYGTASGLPLRLSDESILRTFYAPALNQSLHVFNLGLWFMMRPHVIGDALGALIGLVMGGRITPPPVQLMPLHQAAEAHRRLEQREQLGRIVLKPWA